MIQVVKNKNIPLRGNYKVLTIILVSLIMAFVVSSFVISINRVVGISMEPTLQETDWVLVNRLAYIKSTPNYNDIIIFRKKDVTNDIVIKRVVAKPNDTVEIMEGKLIINGSVQENTFRMSDSENMKKITVDSESYFVLGDNRNNSKDSRHWENQFVSKADIIGKVIF